MYIIFSSENARVRTPSVPVRTPEHVSVLRGNVYGSFDRSDTTKNIFGIAQVEILVKIWIWSFAEAVESWTESDQKS